MPNVIKQIVKDGADGTQTIKMIVRDNERGPQGDKGDTGAAATISAGQAYSVPAGQQPSVINAGSSADAIFDFYIPKGEKGEKGDKGDDGAVQYTAGAGIRIKNNTISVIGGGGGGDVEWGDIKGSLNDQTDLFNILQIILGQVGSASQTAIWGKVVGNLSNQTDLANALDGILREGRHVYYGNCDTEDGILQKEVYIAPDPFDPDVKPALVTGDLLIVDFSDKETSSNDITFEINDENTYDVICLPWPVSSIKIFVLDGEGNLTDLLGRLAVPGVYGVTTLYNGHDSSAINKAATAKAVKDVYDAIPTVNNSTISFTNNGTAVDSFTTNASANKTIDFSAPVITMTTTDPGEGSPLAANNFIAVYSAS